MVSFVGYFATSNVFRLTQSATSKLSTKESGESLGGRSFFTSKMDYEAISAFVNIDIIVSTSPITDEFRHKEYKNLYESDSMPIFVLSSDKETVIPFSVDNPPTPQVGDSIIALTIGDKSELIPTQTIEETT